MTVWVVASEDIVKASGEVIMKGTRGYVVDVMCPPAPIAYDVMFDGEDLSRYVQDDKLTFEDGNIGKIRAFFEGQQKMVSVVEYVDTPVDIEPFKDLEKGNRNALRFSFSDGRVLYVTVDTATGDLDFVLD